MSFIRLCFSIFMVCAFNVDALPVIYEQNHTHIDLTKYNLLGEKCCSSCVLPLQKYFMLNKATCAETCITPKQYNKYAPFFVSLQPAKKSTLPCEYYNYHIYRSTDVKGHCPFCLEFDVYHMDEKQSKRLENL